MPPKLPNPEAEIERLKTMLRACKRQHEQDEATIELGKRELDGARRELATTTRLLESTEDHVRSLKKTLEDKVFIIESLKTKAESVQGAPAPPNPQTPSSVRVSQKSSSSPSTATPLASKRLSQDSRATFVSLYKFYRAEIDQAAALEDSQPGAKKAQNKNYTEALEFVKSMNPQWEKITLSFADQLLRDSANGKVRFAKGGVDKKYAPDPAVRKNVLDILTPLNDKGAIFSVRGAWETVLSKLPTDATEPCMSTVFIIMKEAGFKIKRFEEASALEDAEIEFRIERYRLEHAYFTDKYKVHPRLTINIDESALRLVPTKQYSWCLEGTANKNKLFDRFPLKRNYTTLTAGVSQTGKKLQLMVNWKGTDRLAIEGHKVLQYSQTNTHWNTTESFIHYLERVVIPFVKGEWSSMSEAERSGYSGDFMVVIDCAPIHISLKTRERIAKLFDGPTKGHLVFLPPGCTAKTQPLDIGCFGPVKSTARYTHLQYLTTIYENRADRRKNLATTVETRKMALDAIQTGWNTLRESTIVHAWETSLDSRDNAGKDVLASRLKDRSRRAADRILSEQRARNEHQAVLDKCKEEGKKPPRCAEASRWIFRFGLPGSSVGPAEEATEDALLLADTTVQLAAVDSPVVALPGMEDEADILLPIEGVQLDPDGKIASTASLEDSDADIGEEGNTANSDVVSGSRAAQPAVVGSTSQEAGGSPTTRQINFDQ